MRRRTFLATASGVCAGVIGNLPGSAAERPAPSGARKAPAGPGTPVVVTKEMLGAGIVSSGVTLPPMPKLTGNRAAPVASWGKPLPYPMVIADRRNNRLIEVTPEKRIVWEFPSPNLKVYRGNEDVNFSPDGRQLAVSEEDNYDVHIVDYEKRALTWTYGTPDVKGSAPGFLDYPDDAHILDDGMFLTADIRNCRVLIIDPATRRVSWEYSVAKGESMLDHPSLARELPAIGDIIVADDHRERVVVIDRKTKQFIWQYGVPDLGRGARGSCRHRTGLLQAM